jgi:hypothetical protein
VQVNGEFQYTNEWLMRASRATVIGNSRQRFAMVAVAVVTAVVFAWQDLPDLGALAALLLIAGVSLDWRTLIAMRSRRTPLGTPIRYTLTGQHAEIQTVTGTVQLPWSGVSWVRTLPDMWLLRHNGVKHAIPRAAFSPADQADIDILFAGFKAG